MSSDEEKWLELVFDEMGSVLLGYLKAFLKDEQYAEDVLQNVFIRLLQSKRNNYTIENLRAFLFTLASHEAQRFLSSKKHGFRIVSDPKFLLEKKSESVLSDEEVLSLQESLMSLPWEQQEIVYLKIYAQMTFEEIALCLSIPVNTAASRYRYGMEKLKKTWGE